MCSMCDWIIKEIICLLKYSITLNITNIVLNIPGKERLVEGIAGVLDCKICVNQTKLNLIKMQDNPELTTRLSKSLNSRVHIGKIL